MPYIIDNCIQATKATISLNHPSYPTSSFSLEFHHATMKRQKEIKTQKHRKDVDILMLVQLQYTHTHIHILSILLRLLRWCISEKFTCLVTVGHRKSRFTIFGDSYTGSCAWRWGEGKRAKDHHRKGINVLASSSPVPAGTKWKASIPPEMDDDNRWCGDSHR